MKTLHLEPYGGLCNRLRAIDAALALCEELPMKLTVHWFLDGGIGSRMDALFVLPPGMGLVQSDIRTFWGKCQEKLIKRVIKWCGGYTPVFLRLGDAEEEKRRIRSVRITRIKSCEAFYGNGRFLRQLKPVPELQAVIDSYKDRLGGAAVGVQIRRTDHELAIKHSKLENFARLMEQELAANAGQVFFLATDDPGVETEMLARFPSATIIVQKNKLFGRDGPEGIKAAVIDLYCLANCRRILGSVGSSFGAVAAQIYDIPFEEVGKPSV